MKINEYYVKLNLCGEAEMLEDKKMNKMLGTIAVGVWLNLLFWVTLIALTGYGGGIRVVMTGS